MKGVVPGWIFKVAKKRLRFLSLFLLDLLRGRTYYEVDGIKLSFRTPYHHAHALAAVKGVIEPEMIHEWKERAAAITANLGTQSKKVTGTIYDVGGFNGIYGLTAAKANPNTEVSIFEPDPINVAHIRRNIQLNKLSNCRVIPIALTDFKGMQQFSARGTTFSRLGTGGYTVRCEKLDAFPAPDLIKIDAAGAESRIIRGGRISLQEHPSIFLQTDVIDTEHAEMWSTLRKLGYIKTFVEKIPSGERCILEVQKIKSAFLHYISFSFPIELLEIGNPFLAL